MTSGRCDNTDPTFGAALDAMGPFYFSPAPLCRACDSLGYRPHALRPQRGDEHVRGSVTSTRQTGHRKTKRFALELSAHTKRSGTSLLPATFTDCKIRTRESRSALSRYLESTNRALRCSFSTTPVAIAPCVCATSGIGSAGTSHNQRTPIPHRDARPIEQEGWTVLR